MASMEKKPPFQFIFLLFGLLTHFKVSFQACEDMFRTGVQHESCSELASRGFCEMYPEEMAYVCCATCTGATTAPPPTTARPTTRPPKKPATYPPVPCTVKTKGGNANGACCYFPFTLQGGKTYTECTTDYYTKPWCGTTPDAMYWGECITDEPEPTTKPKPKPKPKPKTTAKPKPKPKPKTTAKPQPTAKPKPEPKPEAESKPEKPKAGPELKPAAESRPRPPMVIPPPPKVAITPRSCTRTTLGGSCCYFPFIYKGRLEYNCIMRDYTRPWCGLNVLATEWGVCGNPVNGNWGPWFPFTSCSSLCGPGTRSRTRECDNPPPKNGGAKCPGPAQEFLPCNDRPCPVVTNGNWGQWSYYGPCSAPCGLGKRTKSRRCDSPAPANGGRSCDGPDREDVFCQNVPCPDPAEVERITNLARFSSKAVSGAARRIYPTTNEGGVRGAEPARGSNAGGEVNLEALKRLLDAYNAQKNKESSSSAS